MRHITVEEVHAINATKSRAEATVNCLLNRDKLTDTDRTEIQNARTEVAQCDEKLSSMDRSTIHAIIGASHAEYETDNQYHKRGRGEKSASNLLHPAFQHAPADV